MGVKVAFRQVGADLAGAVNVGFVLGGFLFIDVQQHLDWWRVTSAIQTTQRQTTGATAYDTCHRSGGHRACPGRSTHRSRGETAARALRGKNGVAVGDKGHYAGDALHG